MFEGTLGEIRLFGGDFSPKQWAFCDGTLLQIAENSVLFTVLGTQFGGDGMTTFALPNLAPLAAAGSAEVKYIICVEGNFPQRD